ncbi:MAG TPA: GDP-L-fucose synthase [Thermoanaerobaculia bacterium]
MDKNAPVFVAGHRGLVGSAIVEKLRREGHTSIVVRTRAELDLLDQAAVRRFFSEENIAYVYLAAALAGGIYANATRPADFLYQNLVIATNVMEAAAAHGVEKLLYLGSSCIYPRLAPQPIPESALLTGPLEPTNEAYAIAKIAGLKLCEAYQRQYGKRFISAMPTNLYGPNDTFDQERSHVIPALLRRMHDATAEELSEVVVWGTGTPKREFLYADDLAEALYLLMEQYEELGTINVGSGEEQTVAELANLIKNVVGFKGVVRFDPSRPDGTPRKIIDSSRMHALGWKAQVSLEEGLRRTYASALARGVFSETPHAASVRPS